MVSAMKALLLLLALVPCTTWAEFAKANSLAELRALPADTQAIALGSWHGRPDLEASLRHLRTFKSLRSLNLWQAAIESADLAFLTDLPDLESLTFRGRLGYGSNRIDDKGVDSLLSCPNLKHLKLGALGLTDKACKVIGKLEHLETLNLDANHLTDDGLAHLRSLKGLQQLNLSGNVKINETGI